MKVVVIYREHTDYARGVEMFINDFTRQTGRILDTMDPDSREGANFCRTYDILEYPTIIALSDDGQVQNSWSGTNLPTISEVSYYA